ncbi:MAG: glycosyltransferase [Deltaproteobacteria bacterium]|nr:glycosyltransferase [Deltaproteobacteria bacterium]
MRTCRRPHPLPPAVPRDGRRRRRLRLRGDPRDPFGNSRVISVVIPVYNEEKNLSLLMDRMEAALQPMGRPFEIIFVDDGSRDRSLEVLSGFVGRRGVRVVELTRNYGQHSAVMSGFSIVRGKIVVTLDADLQNPPEEIPSMIRVMEEGNYEVVGTVRRMRRDSLLRTIPSRIVNAMTRKITGVRMTDWGCMLRAYRREVVDRMVESQEYSTFIPALATLYAKRMTEIPVAHEERHGGISNYTLPKLLSLQFDLLTSFSEFPLKVLLYLGTVLSLGGIALGFMLGVMRLVYGAAWAEYGVFTLFAILFFFVGGLFFALGIMGQYVGRIYHEVRKRPRFTIRKVHGE